MARDDDDILLEEELTAAFFDDDEEDEQPQEETQQEEQQSTEQPEAEQKEEWLESDGVPGQLAVDVYETDKELAVKAPIAGVDKESIDVSIADNTLTIRGTREQTAEIKEENYFVQECYWGEFSRSIILPVQVKEDEADAELKDGVLTVVFPKTKPDTVKKISIR